jgi:hypothetical protein
MVSNYHQKLHAAAKAAGVVIPISATTETMLENILKNMNIVISRGLPLQEVEQSALRRSARIAARPQIKKESITQSRNKLKSTGKFNRELKEQVRRLDTRRIVRQERETENQKKSKQKGLFSEFLKSAPFVEKMISRDHSIELTRVTTWLNIQFKFSVYVSENGEIRHKIYTHNTGVGMTGDKTQNEVVETTQDRFLSRYMDSPVLSVEIVADSTRVTPISLSAISQRYSLDNVPIFADMEVIKYDGMPITISDFRGSGKCGINLIIKNVEDKSGFKSKCITPEWAWNELYPGKSHPPYSDPWGVTPEALEGFCRKYRIPMYLIYFGCEKLNKTFLPDSSHRNKDVMPFMCYVANQHMYEITDPSLRASISKIARIKESGATFSKNNDSSLEGKMEASMLKPLYRMTQVYFGEDRDHPETWQHIYDKLNEMDTQPWREVNPLGIDAYILHGHVTLKPLFKMIYNNSKKICDIHTDASSGNIKELKFSDHITIRINPMIKELLAWCTSRGQAYTGQTPTQVARYVLETIMMPENTVTASVIDDSFIESLIAGYARFDMERFGRPNDLTLENVKDLIHRKGNRCELSARVLEWKQDAWHWTRGSLDRKDNNQPHLLTNLMVTNHCDNCRRRSTPVEEFKRANYEFTRFYSNYNSESAKIPKKFPRVGRVCDTQDVDPNNVVMIDKRKCYRECLRNNEYPFPVFSSFDEIKEWNKNDEMDWEATHTLLPGFYEAKFEAIGRKFTFLGAPATTQTHGITRDNHALGWFSVAGIMHAYKKGWKITFLRKIESTYQIPHNFYCEFIEAVLAQQEAKIIDEAMAKFLINAITGYTSKVDSKTCSSYFTKSFIEAVLIHVDTLHAGVDSELLFDHEEYDELAETGAAGFYEYPHLNPLFQVKTNFKKQLPSNTLTVWNQMVDYSHIWLDEMYDEIMSQEPKAKLLQINTDSLTFLMPKASKNYTIFPLDSPFKRETQKENAMIELGKFTPMKGQKTLNELCDNYRTNQLIYERRKQWNVNYSLPVEFTLEKYNLSRSLAQMGSAPVARQEHNKALFDFLEHEQHDPILCYIIKKLINQGGRSLARAAEILDSRVSMTGSMTIQGRAGTGKTTVMADIALHLQETGKKVLVLTPTNKARVVINKKTGNKLNAQTIYKGLNIKVGTTMMETSGKFLKAIDYIVCDEISMFHSKMYELLRDLQLQYPHLKFILVGDFYQHKAVKDKITGERKKNGHSCYSIWLGVKC